MISLPIWTHHGRNAEVSARTWTPSTSAFGPSSPRKCCARRKNGVTAILIQSGRSLWRNTRFVWGRQPFGCLRRILIRPWQGWNERCGIVWKPKATTSAPIRSFRWKSTFYRRYFFLGDTSCSSAFCTFFSSLAAGTAFSKPSSSVFGAVEDIVFMPEVEDRTFSFFKVGIRRHNSNRKLDVFNLQCKTTNLFDSFKMGQIWYMVKKRGAVGVTDSQSSLLAGPSNITERWQSLCLGVETVQASKVASARTPR